MNFKLYINKLILYNFIEWIIKDNFLVILIIKDKINMFKNNIVIVNNP